MTRATSTMGSDEDPFDRRIRRTWRLLLVSLGALVALLALRAALGGSHLVDLLTLSLVAATAYAAILHRNAFRELEQGRRAEIESFARILRGLSRSVSPDAIVEAIVEDLAHGTGADHIVVVRRRPGAAVLEATLVSRRPGVRSATTLFPLADLEDPGAQPDDLRPVRAVVPVLSGKPPAPEARTRVAEQIASRARTAYGLTHTLSAPLYTDEAVIGALVISRRTSQPWPASARRILAGAAEEASAALTRAFSHRDAETRASTDALTGLPNRRYFDEFCGLLARRRRAEDALGVLMIDIDRFKTLNDTHGHATGDEVLRAVGGAIGGAVREDDVPARYGGEEFAVLLRNPTPSMAVEVGERVREAVGRLDLQRLGVPAVSVSVGVAVGGGANRPIAELIEDADRALYEAKRRGRDRVVGPPPAITALLGARR